MGATGMLPRLRLFFLMTMHLSTSPIIKNIFKCPQALLNCWGAAERTPDWGEGQTWGVAGAQELGGSSLGVGMAKGGGLEKTCPQAGGTWWLNSDRPGRSWGPSRGELQTHAPLLAHAHARVPSRGHLFIRALWISSPAHPPPVQSRGTAPRGPLGSQRPPVEAAVGTGPEGPSDFV